MTSPYGMHAGFTGHFRLLGTYRMKIQQLLAKVWPRREN